MTLILKNCRVVGVSDGNIREASIAIQDGRIQALQKRGSGDETFDAKGLYVLPGLISCHTHLSIVFPFHESDENENPAITAIRCVSRANDALRAGVTTVRTVSEKHRADITLRTMIQKGWATGPRIFSAGRGISTTGGHGAGFGVITADGPEEFRKAVRQELHAGANHIKIFISGGIAQRGEAFDESQMTFEEVKAAVDAATAKGSYVCAHSSGAEPIQQAVRAGVRCFEHTYCLDRKTAVAIKEAGAFVVPTLCVTRSPGWMRAHGFEDWTIQKGLSAGPGHLDSIRTAVRAGITLVNGTDIPPGDTDSGIPVAIKEMEYMRDAGLTNLQAIQASTTNAAKLIRAEKELGVVAPGFHADLIGVAENPLKDIRALAKPVFIMQAGRLVHGSFP